MCLFIAEGKNQFRAKEGSIKRNKGKDISIIMSIEIRQNMKITMNYNEPSKVRLR